MQLLLTIPRQSGKTLLLKVLFSLTVALCCHASFAQSGFRCGVSAINDGLDAECVNVTVSRYEFGEW